ncbi:MAG: sugar ABC transporter ATP-binding protein [Thaumarchaeota archaeon]|nr:sugar ABC transporter ATP-binding protein [Nitrososphaerota archaeon]
MEEVLVLEDITKRFGAITAVSDVDLTLYKGELLGLIGDNAAGKSTLLKIIAGVYKPDAGRIILENEEVQFDSPMDARLRGIEMVFQDFMVCPELDVISNVFLGREMTKGQFLKRRLMEKILKEKLKELKFDIPSLKKKVKFLSGGQQQIVAILRTLLFDPKILLLDEPTANLSAMAAMEVMSFIRKLIKQRNISGIYVAHDLPSIIKFSDRILVMRSGKIIAEKKPDETDPLELIKLMRL